MADTPPKILQAPTSPLWYHVTVCAVLGLGLALVFAFVLAGKDTMAAEGVTGVFRAARLPLLQYRAEKGAWPADFDLAQPPEALQAYGFRAATQAPLEKCGVAGAWRFTAAGKGKPALVFTPAEAGGSAQRVLAAVDAQLDDGQPAAGKFRSDGLAGALTLRDE
jgi:hypothetical protein